MKRRGARPCRRLLADDPRLVAVGAGPPGDSALGRGRLKPAPVQVRRIDDGEVAVAPRLNVDKRDIFGQLALPASDGGACAQPKILAQVRA